MNREQYLIITAENCLNECRRLGIPFGKIRKFEVNTRAKSRWGQTKYNRASQIFEININASLIDGKHDEGLRNTLYHEILHTVPGCFNHGATWNRYGNLIQRELGYKINRAETAEEKGFASGEYEAQVRKAPVKYTFRCSACGQIVTRQRESNFTRNTGSYRCGRCGGKFIRITA